MQASEILNIPSMPIASVSYPRGPYRFINREYMIVEYQSEPEARSQASLFQRFLKVSQ
jgi:acetoacetate decarboxylase